MRIFVALALLSLYAAATLTGETQALKIYSAGSLREVLQWPSLVPSDREAGSEAYQRRCGGHLLCRAATHMLFKGICTGSSHKK